MRDTALLSWLDKQLGHPSPVYHFNQEFYEVDPAHLRLAIDSFAKGQYAHCPILQNYMTDLLWGANPDAELLRYAILMLLDAWLQSLDGPECRGFASMFHLTMYRKPRLISDRIGDSANAALVSTICSALLKRIDAQRGIENQVLGWLPHFNSTAAAWPEVAKTVLGRWYGSETHGAAACWIVFLSRIAYGDEENPLVQIGRRDVVLWEQACIDGHPVWSAPALEALGAVLETPKVYEKLREIPRQLGSEHGHEDVALVCEDIMENQMPKFERRRENLLRNLASEGEGFWDDSLGIG